MIIIGTGSRDWTDIFPIRKVMMDIKEKYPAFTYYHGAQRGFDIKSAVQLKMLKHYDIKPFYADWKQYGDAAGMIRNREMLAAALRETTPQDILLIAMPLASSI